MSTEAARRESRARRSFRLKVERLESLANDGNSPSVHVPRTLAEVVAWEDRSLGFSSWKSFSVAVLNGPNGDLRRRLDIALERLRSPPSTVGTKKPRRGRAVEHVQALAEVRALAQQNAELLEEKLQIQGELRRLRQSLAILQRREAELVSTLNTLLPIDRQLRPIAGG